MNEHCVRNVNAAASPNLYLFAGMTDPQSDLDLANQRIRSIHCSSHTFTDHISIYTDFSTNRSATKIRGKVEARYNLISE